MNQMEAINLLKYHTTQKSSQILTTLGLTTFDINVYLHLEWIAIEKICLHRLLFYISSLNMLRSKNQQWGNV